MINQLVRLETEKLAARANAVPVARGFGRNHDSTETCALSPRAGHSEATCQQYRVLKCETNEGAKRRIGSEAAMQGVAAAAATADEKKSRLEQGQGRHGVQRRRQGRGLLGVLFLRGTPHGLELPESLKTFVDATRRKSQA